MQKHTAKLKATITIN